MIEQLAGRARISTDGMTLAIGRRPLMQRMLVRLLLLTLLFILVADVVTLIPSVSCFRLRWLEERLATAASISLVLHDKPPGFSGEGENELLKALGVQAIAIRNAGVSTFLAVADIDIPKEFDEHIVLGEIGPVDTVIGALKTVFFGGNYLLRVVGNAPGGNGQLELIFPDGKLRKAMLGYVRNTVLLSLIISIITGILVFTAINRTMIEPVRRIRRSLLSFAEGPEDPARILHPSGRLDELGAAEVEISGLQLRLQKMLSQQRHLAELGLAVSKINHDVRNILASVRLLSDRLVLVKDPAVQAIAPKLAGALDRAVEYLKCVLAYGHTQEPPVRREAFRLRKLIDEVGEALCIDPALAIQFENQVDDGFEVDADPEHLFRILMNLGSNAVEALRGNRNGFGQRRLAFAAERKGGVCRILVTDTGPGLPQKALNNMFLPFRCSARSGGTGLGLAISNELARAHQGGKLELVESVRGHTVFAVSIPDRSLTERCEA